MRLKRKNRQTLSKQSYDSELIIILTIYIDPLIIDQPIFGQTFKRSLTLRRRLNLNTFLTHPWKLNKSAVIHIIQIAKINCNIDLLIVIYKNEKRRRRKKLHPRIATY